MPRMNIWFASALALMGFGWFTGWTPIGATLIVSGSLLAVGLLGYYRSPQALTHFALSTALGWWVVFVATPILFAIPVTALLIARLWGDRLKRRETVGPGDASQAL